VLEIDDLLRKYAGGRIPPFVPASDKPEDSGLLNGRLVEIYQRGFADRYSIPLGILAAERVWQPVAEKWQCANYSLNRSSQAEWTGFCAAVRSGQGNAACEACDRDFAARAEVEGAPIAYLCCHGLIDFAVPVRINGKIIAVLFSGQLKPKAGCYWNPEMTEPTGLFHQLETGQVGVDISEESNLRIARAERTLGYATGELSRRLDEDINSKRIDGICPDGVRTIIEQLSEAAGHLSNLATATYQLESARIIAAIRGKAAESLKFLTADPTQPIEFWETISAALQMAAEYFGSEYIAVLACDSEPSPSVKILAQWPPAKANGSQPAEVSTDGIFVKSLLKLAKEARDLRVVPAAKFVPAINRFLPKLTKKGDPLVLSAVHSKTSATHIVMGCDSRVELSTLANSSQLSLADLLGAIAMITEVARLIQELEVTAERQTSFVLDMAHDLRNPIQNVIVLADVLKNAALPVDKVVQHASRIATQVRRLNLLSQRVWTLVTIEREGFDATADRNLRLYDIVNQWVDLLQDSAASRAVTVVVDRDLKNWSPVFVNELLCTQAVLNLVDNAIKYSSGGTEVRISGDEDADTYNLRISNRGIGIPPDEIDRIFEKFHRARVAQEHVREGTGIGLAVVKLFADHYGNVSVTSDPIRGSRDYKTVFSLSVRKRSVRYV